MSSAPIAASGGSPCKGAALPLAGRGISNGRTEVLGFLHRLLDVFDGEVSSCDRLLMRRQRLPDAHQSPSTRAEMTDPRRGAAPAPWSNRIMPEEPAAAPDSTAVRTALWRAMHVEVDPPPHVLEDEIGLRLAAPDEGWRNRQDMHPQWTRGFRAAIVARARYIEDLVAQQADQGVGQYVILGAGLDSFAQRRPELASRLRVFEVDRPGPQQWKHQRLIELGFGVPAWLRLVPVDFEAGASWWERLVDAGFDAAQPAVVVSTGVTMYLTKEAIAATLRQVALLAPR
ncbi:MAG TPA: class I SAM-dependent methyltransferase [Kofleriaceae bacterium]|nr:class I SAM-dependent methyltransferase [Kofleriaceae bacterium]